MSGSCIKSETGTSSRLVSALGNNMKMSCPVADIQTMWLRLKS